ncbi:MAG: hypothetical protein E7364_00515 [Clostridiales bacterium]|nr:hypothetical protein [Clostridiales bacterium]
MRSEEFISTISALSQGDEKFEEIRYGLPLGLDAASNLALAQKTRRPLTVRNTCVTGINTSNFIRRMLISVSCLFERDEACFFILSPKTEYGELLRLKSIDATVPYVRLKSDLDIAVDTLKELLLMRENGTGYPHLFIVLDGLENLPDCNKSGDLEEYRAIFELIRRREDVDVICGVDLTHSIFGGYPGAFVGIGNCLVSLREDGKADVTYVKEDASLSLPVPITYPSAPSVLETVIFLNSLPKDE